MGNKQSTEPYADLRYRIRDLEGTYQALVTRLAILELALAALQDERRLQDAQASL